MDVKVLLFTDGGYSKKNNKGGNAYILQYLVFNETYKLYELKKEYSESQTVENTTSNRMELMPVINGLNYLTKPCKVEVISDSTYVVDTINKWIGAFVKDPNRANYDLMVLLKKAMDRHIDVKSTWIRGHSGDIINERVNEMAQIAAGTFKGKLSYSNIEMDYTKPEIFEM